MQKNTIENFCQAIQENYKKKGLEEFELSISESQILSAQTRNINLENIESSNNVNVTINLMVGKKQATLSANNINNINVESFLEKGKFMADSSPEDPYSGLPESDQYANEILELDLEDKNYIDEKKLTDFALQAEDAMLSIKKVSNTEGATASSSKSKITFMSSKGFFNNYVKTVYSISSIAIAGKNTGMQRDYDYSAAVHLNDLREPSDIGKKAGERAVARLNSKKINSCIVDVVFEPRIAKSLISSLATCISGTAVARGTTFLSKKINEKICKDIVKVTNLPLLSRGVGSIPFDARGIKTQDINLIEKGYFRNYLLGLRSAKQLNLKPNGNSSPCNLTLNPGNSSAESIISSIKKGFYVTEMLGMSFNTVSGDYSRGAAGFMIENGEVTFPVNEVTIAGNMIDILKKIEPADDLDIIENINSPTILVEKMSLAGI